MNYVTTKRVAVVYLPSKYLVDVLNWGNAPDNMYLDVFESVSLPRNSKVLSVFPAPERNAIGCVVHHESFGEVPDGTVPPDMIGNVAWKVVEKKS